MVRTKRILTILLSIAVIMALSAVMLAAPPNWDWEPDDPQPGYLDDYVSAAGIKPVLYTGNTSDQSEDYGKGFKADYGDGHYFNGPTGTFPFVMPTSESTSLFKFYVDGNTDRVLKVWLSRKSGNTYISRWEAVNMEIKIFLLKGGNAFNAYFYDEENPALMSDEGLYPPVNASGGPAGLSHFVVFYTTTTTETTTVETTTEETTTEETTTEETTTEETTTEETTTEETTTEETTTEETTTEETTTEETTTEETTTEEGSSTLFRTIC